MLLCFFRKQPQRAIFFTLSTTPYSHSGHPCSLYHKSFGFGTPSPLKFDMTLIEVNIEKFWKQRWISICFCAANMLV